VFAGQIFAEMLAGICHKEFYNQSDQEEPSTHHFTSPFKGDANYVHTPSHGPSSFGLVSLIAFPFFPGVILTVGLGDSYKTHLLPALPRAKFSRMYHQKIIHDTGNLAPETQGVTLSSTKLYCDPGGGRAGLKFLSP